jgi:DNA segregation ATPase FtsK/SpoIIIE, S-DNA-T family
VAKRGTRTAKGVADRRRADAGARSLDLEAVGLVLLTVGLALAGLLAPALPSGELGEQTREALMGRLGLGAWALPWPFAALGGLFLMRRNPRAWPRVVTGYALAATGVWGFAMLFAPELTGAWGGAARASLTGAAGALAVVPAFVVLTLGVELMAGLTPTRIVRGLLRIGLRLVRLSWTALVAWRRRARARASFNADVARVRHALVELDRDLGALERLYKASSELERWRRSVRETLKRLQRATTASLQEASADVHAWQAAVRDFAKDRAGELRLRLGDEGARPPLPGGGDGPGADPPVGHGAVDFETWSRAVKALLDDPIQGDAASLRAAAAPRALDRVRSALALDLTALGDRHRRLTRDRDLDERALERMTPRELAKASDAHGERSSAYRGIERDAVDLSEAAVALDAWRHLGDALLRAYAAHPGARELIEYDQALADAIKQRGRDELAALDGWSDALEQVVLRAREDEVLRARRAAAESAATAGAVEAGAVAGGDPVDAALLDEAQVHLSEHAAWVTEGGADDAGRAASTAAGLAADGASAVAVAAAETADPDDGPPWELEDGAGRGAGTAAARAAARAPAAAGSAAPVRSDAPAEVGGIPLQLPAIDLLDPPEPSRDDPRELARESRQRVAKIDATLSNFKLEGRVVSSVRGPSVTRFEVEPAPGEKISRFANLSDDLALAMAVGSVRIEAPIPGKSVIGLEVPNAQRELIRFREAIESPSYRRSSARLPLILGRSIDGEMVVGDLARMPHLLLAGSTGSGKSVAVNTLIQSLLYRFLPPELRFLMIDPKMVELTPYDGIPHLIRPVVTNPSDAAGVLLGAVAHMERRYKMMSKIGAKNLDQYNAKARNLDLPELPFIIVVIDELADLMITSPKEVESAIMRLAQMARATGMHLILATQRPSVDILTSLIKVNVPARLAFAVSSGFDSRTILDTMGAERLIGLGDLLFYQPGLVKPMRLQGPFVSEAEIGSVAAFLRRQYFDDDFVEAYGDDFEPASPDDSDASGYIDWNDDKLRQAAELVVHEGQASVSRLQRRLQVGHARAGKLMDSLEALGVVGPHSGSKPREVLVTSDDLPNVFGR